VSAIDTYIFVIVLFQAANRPTSVKKHSNVPPPSQGVSLPLMISFIFDVHRAVHRNIFL